MTSFERTVTTQKPVNLRELTEGKTGAQVATYTNGIQAVIKSRRAQLPSGNTTQRELSVKSQPYREVAYWRLALLLDASSRDIRYHSFAEVVPETVLLPPNLVSGNRTTSAQVFMPAQRLQDINPVLKEDGPGTKSWNEALRATCGQAPIDQWLRVCILDIIAASRDRHANNAGLSLQVTDHGVHYKVVAWDNACTFGTPGFYRYHNVFHKQLFRDRLPLTDYYWEVLSRVRLHDFYTYFDDLVQPYGQITREDVRQAFLRVQFMLHFPQRLPWLVMSRGSDDANGFPTWEHFFKPNVEALYLAVG